MDFKYKLFGSLLIATQLLSSCEEEKVNTSLTTEEKNEIALVNAKSFTANMQGDVEAIIEIEDDVMSFAEHLEQDAENINTDALESHLEVVAQATILTGLYLEPSVVFTEGEVESFELDFSLLPETASIQSYNTGDLQSIFNGEYVYTCDYYTGDSSGNVYDINDTLVNETRIDRDSAGWINMIDNEYFYYYDYNYDFNTGSYNLISGEVCYEEAVNSSEDGFENTFTGDFNYNSATNMLSVTNAQTVISNEDYDGNISTSVVTFSYEVKLPSFNSDGQFSVALTDFSSSDDSNNSINIDNLYFNLDAGTGFSNYDMAIYENTFEYELERLANSTTSFSVGLDQIEINLNGLKVYGSGYLSMSDIEADIDFSEETASTRYGALELGISGGIENSYGEAIEASASISSYYTYIGDNIAPSTVAMNLHLDAKFYQNRANAPTISAIFDLALTANYSDDLNAACTDYETYVCDMDDLILYIESFQIQADYQLIIDGNTYAFGIDADLDLENESVDFTLSQTNNGVLTQLIIHSSSDATADENGHLEMGIIQSNSITVGTVIMDLEQGMLFVEFTDGTTDSLFDGETFEEAMN